MKNQIRHLLLVLVLFSTVNSQLSTVFAQGTAFTYQGQLNDGGTPANGQYDLQFTAYDDSSAGNVVGGPLTQAPVAVSNGLFTVVIDFSDGTFLGERVWLEIGARTNGSVDPYVVLSPRQEMTPTPYAIFSESSTFATYAGNVAGSPITQSQLDTLAPPVDGQVLSYTGGSLSWTDPAVAGGSVWSLSGSSAYYSAGAVGIGTSSPKGALQVASGGVAVTGASSPYTGAGAGIFMESGYYGGALFAFDYSAYQPRPLLLNNPGGNVGIGTISPQAQLHVYDPANSVGDIIETGGGTNAWAKTIFKNLNGEWDIGTSRSFNDDEFYIDRPGNSQIEFHLLPNGFLGLGGEPQAKLHLFDPSVSVSERIETGGGVNAWTRLEFRNANGQWDVGTSRGFNGDQFYIVREGGANPAFAVQPTGDAFVSGNLSACSVTIRGGCDLAEPFPMKEEVIEKGAVVVIDDEHPGQLKLSTRAYDTHVAGVVSGAGGINPGISLQQESVLPGSLDVALTGRVYVQADTSNGAIIPGDLLTTSVKPGRAMKVTDHARAAGAILGKAMTGLKEGNGMVLVLVTLQ